VKFSYRAPIDRLTEGLPKGWRITIDWLVTILGAIVIVLAIKQWVVNPYRIPSSSMEPTLHCARHVPGDGCEARWSDRVLANRFIYHFRDPKRGEIIVFDTPVPACGSPKAGDTFVKRLIGLPGDRIEEKLIAGKGYVFVNGERLKEPYVEPQRRDSRTFTMSDHSLYPGGRLPKNEYFFMGDNRAASCDSRDWGPVPRKDLIGEVFATYWPLNRIGLR
jgi:signal peptidase I